MFHINEGHAGFLALERIRRAMLDDGLSFAEAQRRGPAGRACSRPTRPVPAGIDRFPRELMETYFAQLVPRGAALTIDELMELGHEPGTPEGEVFNMAVMSLRLAGQTNGVAALHGASAGEMFSGMWPDLPADEVPIALGHQRRARPHVGVARDGRPARPRRAATTGPRPPADDVAPARGGARPRAVGRAPRSAASASCSYARRRLRQAAAGHGRRRVAARVDRRRARPDGAHHRLRPPLRHLQAGHAAAPRPRPAARPCCSTSERPGAARLRRQGPSGRRRRARSCSGRSRTFAADLDLRHRLVLLEDYDITVARMLVPGVDVWLNTPLRPLEACGTSGMKAAFNGVLNCSILDGWWDEMYDGDVGWAIPSAEWQDDLERRRRDRGARACSTSSSARSCRSSTSAATAACPPSGCAKVKASMSRVGPRVNASRMLSEYTTELLRAGRRAQRRPARRRRRPGQGASSSGSARCCRAWPSVVVTSTAYDEAPTGERA